MKTMPLSNQTAITDLGELFQRGDVAVKVTPVGTAEARAGFANIIGEARDGAVFVIRHAKRINGANVVLLSEDTLRSLAEPSRKTRTLGDVVRSLPRWGKPLKRVTIATHDDEAHRLRVPVLKASGTR